MRISKTATDDSDLLPEARPNPDSPWYILRIETSREMVVSQQLSCETYLPTFLLRSGKAARIKALYPGYLFARFTSEWQLYSALNTSRVIGLLKFGHEPAMISNSEMEQLKRAVESGQLQRAIDREQPGGEMPAKGNRVEFRYGPFAGQAGTVERVDARKKKRPAIWIRIGERLAREDGYERLKIVKAA